MIFEWDEAKSRRTIEARGFGFGHVSRMFDDVRRLERVDTRRAYGETRCQTIGAVDGRTYFVVFTRRSTTIRIISARRAHDHEDRAYREGTPWR
ncbi:MAG: BrnT family toxin [Proteobacteria bacterium]|nr:BrnT family toxin [Pseudomonadota bacterium]